MDLADLHIFKTVVEEGGIVRASHKLHRVQSSITAISSVRSLAGLVSYAPGCGPCGMPAGWCERLPAAMPRREPKAPFA